MTVGGKAADLVNDTIAIDRTGAILPSRKGENWLVTVSERRRFGNRSFAREDGLVIVGHPA